MLDKTKKLGQVFTPKWLVDEILNASNYMGKGILHHYILEPACGNDFAFDEFYFSFNCYVK